MAPSLGGGGEAQEASALQNLQVLFANQQKNAKRHGSAARLAIAEDDCSPISASRDHSAPHTESHFTVPVCR